VKKKKIAETSIPAVTPPATKAIAKKSATGRAPRAARPRKRPADAPAATPPAAEPNRIVTDEDIRIRAYFLSLEHRGNGRSDTDFWLLAERELKPWLRRDDESA
jgi:hypothetical protein